MPNFIKACFLIFLFLFVNNCGGLSKTDTRTVPVNAQERARKNIDEGRGAGIGGLLKRGNTTFQFTSSNPMWRASLETLDFLPLTTVDYAGGMIISDWYSDTSNNSAIKITIRFLSGEVSSESIKVIVHKKNCLTEQSCKVSSLNQSIIIDELRQSILSKAAALEREDKKKKK
jgi:hypothetical protein